MGENDLKNLRFIALISILVCLLIVIPTSFAIDNETVIGVNDDNIILNDGDDLLTVNNYYFNASVENDTGNGSIDNPYKEFNSDRMHSNSIIHLANGEYNFNGRSDIYDITIIGESATDTIVRAADFTVSTSFTLYNVTFIDSSIINNGYLNVNNCMFINSTSSHYGGVINSKGNVNLDYCTFINNSAQVGGAIYIKEGELSIKNSQFINNYAELFGGAITSVKSDINLENITARNNKAGSEGGAIYSIYDYFTLLKSSFTNNTADNGAAVFVNAAKVNNIENNSFTLNNPLKRASLYSFYNFNSTIKNNNYSDEDDLCETFEINMFLGNGNYTLYWYNDTVISEIPSKFDLRDLGYVTSVKSQGSDGNCWAFATMATLESCILKALGEGYDLSESNLKNLFGSYGDYGWTTETNTGGYASTGYNYLISWLGPIFENDDPYVVSTIFSKIMNSFMHVQNVLFLQRSNFTDNDEIKRALMTYGAVYTPLKANFDINGKQYYHDGTSANHAVVIVGWDDDLVFKGAPGKGGWIIKNSWGETWRNGGYGYVSYYDTTCVPIGKVDSVFTFILNDTIKFDKNYQYDLQGKSDFFLNSSSTVWYKNIFKATDNEYLAAVSTIFEKNTDYEFSIYVNNELQLTQSGSSKPGYYTINLNHLIPLNIGDIFEIVFKISVDGDAGVPISEKVSFNKYYYTENTSFISYDGEKWTDLYELEWKYSTHTYNSQVACIKAFTIFDMLNTTTKLTADIAGGFIVKAQVLNNYNRPVTGGNVTFNVNGVIYEVEVSNGYAILNLFDAPKEYNITGVYNNIGYISSSDNISLNTTFMDTNITLNISSNHNPVNITATVLNEYGSPLNVGKVIFNIDGDEITVDVVNGIASVEHTFKTFGLHNVSAFFNNMYYYKSSKTNLLFNVSLINTDISLTIDDEYNPVSINVKVIDQYGNPVNNGDVTLKLDDGNHIVKVVNGSANLIHTFKSLNFNIEANYNGLYIYNSSHCIHAISVKSTILSNDDVKTLNSNYKFNLIDKNGNPLNSTNVTLSIGKNNYNVMTDKNGNAELTITLAPGNYVISIANPVSSEIKTQNIKVVKRINGNSDIAMYYGEGKYYKVKVLDDNGKIAKGVNVKFTINGKSYTRTTDSKGYASIKISQKPGTYTVTVEYKGFKASNMVKVKTTIITKNKSFKKGKTIKFTAKLLSSKGKILKNKKVTFKFKGKTYKIKTNKKGIATLKITKKYKVGKYTITSKYGSLSVKNTIKIKK